MANILYLFTFLCLITLVCSQSYEYKGPYATFTNPPASNNPNLYNTGYNVSTPLSIHLICHSHCDSGWLKTFNEYFQDEVNFIIDHIVSHLSQDPTKKFIWSEVGFLEKWFSQASELRKQDMRNLVNSGQLEFVGGGWVMNDEACADVPSVINQITEGHQFLAKTFNSSTMARPVNGWQIDPFGHSAVTPALLSAMGYKHLVLNRISNRVKEQLRNSKSDLQFIWRGNPQSGTSSDIMAHVLDDHYSFPRNFNGYNGEENVFDLLLKEGRFKETLYSAPVVMIPMGDDFQYMDANGIFLRIDNAIKFSKTLKTTLNSKVEIKYSTLRDYFKELDAWAATTDRKFNQYSGDFYPYGKPGDWWTGYFTTRPVVKGLARSSQASYRVAKTLTTYGTDSSICSTLRDSNRNISIFQHHDGITGTSKQHVMEDYTNRLLDATQKSKDASISILKKMNKINETVKVTALSNSKPEELVNKFTPIVIVNSLGWSVTDIQSIRFKLPVSKFFGLSAYSKCPIRLMEDRRKDVESYDCSILPDNIVELAFKVTVHPVGITTLFVCNEPSSTVVVTLPELYTQKTSMEFDKYMLSFNQVTKLLESVSIKNKPSAQTDLLKHSIGYYSDAGGAYSFMPRNTEAPRPVPIVKSTFTDGKFKKTFSVTTSPTKDLFQDITVVYTIKNTGIVEQDQQFTVDYHIHGENNEDIVSKFTTNFLPESEFYTDNGLYLMKRQSKPANGEIAEYTFPTISLTLLNDTVNKKILACNSDRTRGVSSSMGSEFEFYLHRALGQDDNKGLGEFNADMSWLDTRDQCYITTRQDTQSFRKSTLGLNNPLSLFAIQGQIPEPTIDSFKFSSKNILKELPNNIHLLSFEKNEINNVLIRLINNDNSKTITLKIDDYFLIDDLLLVETELTGMGYIENVVLPYPLFRRSNKTILTNGNMINEPSTPTRIKGTTITLYPYEIKTFMLYNVK